METGLNKGRMRIAWLLLCAVMAITSIPRVAQGQAKGLAILVVGNAKNQIMTAREKEALEILTRFRDRLGLDDNALPILSYHFNKTDEKVYCENSLAIKTPQLLFVGVVEQEDRAARKVLMRINSVTDPYAASLRVMTAVARRLGKDPATLRTAVTTPPQTPSGPALSFLRIDVVNRSSQPQTRFTSKDAGVFFHVFFHNNHASRQHRHNLQVRVLRADGAQAINPPLGGPFTVEAGENTDDVNLIKRADNDHATGYAIEGKAIANQPGTYTVVATLDGREVGRTAFEIQGGPAATSGGGVEIANAIVVDYDGNRRDQFSLSDRGAYAMVFLRNTASGSRHTHTFRLLCFGPDARKYGQTLGGSFTVNPGQDISKMNFPRDVDPNHSNGYRIKDNLMGQHPGTYRFVIEIDGHAVKTLYFRVGR